jgi:hypothetical protein
LMTLFGSFYTVRFRPWLVTLMELRGAGKERYEKS